MLFWMLWFAAARALFFAWHWGAVPAADRAVVAQSFWYGARMDLSAAAYVAAVQWLILTLTMGVSVRITRGVLRAYSAFIVFFIPVITLTDIGTFGPWRRRLDASIWTYLASAARGVRVSGVDCHWAPAGAPGVRRHCNLARVLATRPPA